jgi:hypothetical protein
MTLQACPQGSPEDDDPDAVSRHGHRRFSEVSLDELLRLGEQEYLASEGRHRQPQRRAWLRRASALTFGPSERPVLRLVCLGGAMPALVAVTSVVVPQAVPEVCSTMMLVLANEFVRLLRQRRSAVAVAG